MFEVVLLLLLSMYSAAIAVSSAVTVVVMSVFFEWSKLANIELEGKLYTQTLRFRRG